MVKRESLVSLCAYRFIFLIVLVSCRHYQVLASNDAEYVSAIGDPGMRRDELRVAIESWNQCNEVGFESSTGSPRAADCFDIHRTPGGNKIEHKVTEEDNALGVDKAIPGGNKETFNDVDLYAPEKELYLASKCQVMDNPRPWNFWMLMLKNGNMDTWSGKCPLNGYKAPPFEPDGRFDCFGEGCMSHPKIHHQYTSLDGENALRGGFYGSWDVDVDLSKGPAVSNTSYYNVTWTKEIGSGSWVFHNVLKTTKKYPWLMLYLRSDATHGVSGGYHYETRGMSKIIPESPNFKVRLTLNIIKGGGPNAQFYLTDIGGCWKNDGRPCDGDVTTDVTRYSEMIINPETTAWCKPDALYSCPPRHTFKNGTVVHRNDTSRFPYSAYHMFCSPGNAKYLEEPMNLCDPFSNPQAQEIMQILPHPVWGEYGYPTKQGDGWVGDGPRTWELDIGGMSQNLYFYQDPGTKPARRMWMSLNSGVEIYRDGDQEAEWTISDFNILVPKGTVN